MFRGHNSYRRPALALAATGAVLLAGCSTKEVQSRAGSVGNDVKSRANAAASAAARSGGDLLGRVGFGLDDYKQGVSPKTGDRQDTFSLGFLGAVIDYVPDGRATLILHSNIPLARAEIDATAQCLSGDLKVTTTSSVSERAHDILGKQGVHFEPGTFEDPNSSVCGGNAISGTGAPLARKILNLMLQDI